MSPNFNDRYCLHHEYYVFQTKSTNFFTFPFFSPSFSIIFYFFRLSMFSWFRSRREKRRTSDRSQQLVFLEVRWLVEKEKKKQYVLFWKISHDMRDHVRQLSTTAAFFYFEMKFDYWHVQELILENWLDRIWIVCCNSRNTVVSMVKDLMNIILFKSFFF